MTHFINKFISAKTNLYQENISEFTSQAEHSSLQSMTHKELFSESENLTQQPLSSPIPDKTMSPSLEQITLSNEYNQNAIYQQKNIAQTDNYSFNQYASSPPPKKSFCIEALLSKHDPGDTNVNNDKSQSLNFTSEEDVFQKYTSDRDYTSSPDETSRLDFYSKLL